MNDEFYKAFEDEFRGEEEEIKRKLTFYTPLLKAYSEAYPSSKPKALDIGCGRGEMLSLYEELGFEAFGIDTNKIMVSYASSKGLHVELSDAISFLKAQDSNTYDVISLIHVLEHLPFEYAFELYKEVFRTLKEGGSFIIEFPYTDNIPMGTIDFYLDPTHLKPIHPKAVKFILEYDGFIGVSYHGLNGVDKDPQSIGFEDAFSYTVAPNVALIATKPTPNKLFLEKAKLLQIPTKPLFELKRCLISRLSKSKQQISKYIKRAKANFR
jgi:2-polyprenyl-3-methyl-5-hydroxy-6-metoxy-1,4-benzoquinol methylase